MSFVILERKGKETIGYRINDGKDEVYLLTYKSSIYHRKFKRPNFKKAEKALSW